MAFLLLTRKSLLRSRVFAYSRLRLCLLRTRYGDGKLVQRCGRHINPTYLNFSCSGSLRSRWHTCWRTLWLGPSGVLGITYAFSVLAVARRFCSQRGRWKLKVVRRSGRIRAQSACVQPIKTHWRYTRGGIRRKKSATGQKWTLLRRSVQVAHHFSKPSGANSGRFHERQHCKIGDGQKISEGLVKASLRCSLIFISVRFYYFVTPLPYELFHNIRR